MNPALVKFGLSIGESLAKASLRPASRFVLGEPEQRALEKISRAAAVQAIGNIAATGDFSDADLEHASSLLERLMSGAASADFPLLPDDSGSRYEVLAGWREIASRQGLDPDTFPLPFEPLVNELLRTTAEETLAAAAKPDNPLFRATALAELESLRGSVAKLARQMEFDVQVELALTAAYESCERANRRLMTPDVLFALLSLKDGSVAACFATVSLSWPDRLREALRAYLSAADAGPFGPFKWGQRPEVRKAKVYAWAKDAAVVTGPALLLGVLDTPSETSKQLAELMGDDIEVVWNSAWRSFDDPGQQGTPGLIFQRGT